MAKRSLDELQKRYASAAAADGGRGPGGMHGPGPRRPMGEGGKGKYSRATVQRLLSYIAVYRGRIILALVFMVINTLTALAGTFLLRDVINVVNPRNTDPAKSTVVRLFMPWITQDNFAQQRLNCLVMVAAVLAVVYLIGILTNYLQNRLMVTVSQNATERLRNDLFRKLQHLPVRYFDANTTGELMSRFTNDIDAIDNMINSTVTSLISGAISLVGTLIMMLYLNIWLTLITLAFIPLFLFSGKAIAKRSVAILDRFDRESPLDTLSPVVTAEELVEAIRELPQVYINRDMMGYITSIVEKTRSYPKVLLGVSPRGALALMKAAKGYAAISGRNYVTPDDVKRAAHPVLDHRLLLENAARIKKNAAYEVIEDVLGMVTVPTESVFDNR